MTKTEKARIIVKINDLEKEKARTERKLKEAQNDHSAAWEIYGSELCAGSMHAKENKLSADTRELERKIAYLKDCLRDHRDLKADEEMLKRKIKELDDRILSLQIERDTHWNTLVFVSFAKKVCSGGQ